MPTTVHPDFWGQSITSYFFSHKGIINIYEYYANLPAKDPLAVNFLPKYLYIYPPLTYFTQGFLNLLVRPFMDSGFIPSLIANPSTIMSFKGALSQIFIMKLPYLFIDIAAGFVLASIFTGKKKLQAFALWMLNPLAIYATFMIGQNDILPVFFTILSLYFFSKKNYKWAVLSMGVGGSYKLYPLLLLFPLVFAASGAFTRRVKLLILGFLPYLVTLAPFINSQAYREIVLLNPESLKILHMGLPVSGAEFVFPFMALLVFTYFLSFYQKERLSPNNFFLAILLLTFSVTHYHPQWFFWITPFFVLELVKSGFRRRGVVTVLVSCWFLTTLFFEPSLSYGLFYPVNSNLKEALDLSSAVARWFDPFMIKSVIRSVFAGASLYFVYDVFKVPKNTS